MMFEFIVNKLLLILTLVLLLLQATEEAMDVEYEEQEYQGKNADANGHCGDVCEKGNTLYNIVIH